MTGKRLVCLFVFAAILLCGGPVLAEEPDCTECDDCATDPSFTQRDGRNPAVLQLLRKFAPMNIQEEGVMAVVILYDGECGCDAEVSPDAECGCDAEVGGEAKGPKRRVVLVGRKGARWSFEVTGALPAEVRAIVPAK